MPAIRVRTRITEAARARGFTAAELARRLGWYRSNISAMDAGRRAVSLRTLARLSQLLACSPGELVEICRESARPLFPSARLNDRVSRRDRSASDGAEKSWVHAAQLAWQRHHGRTRRRR